MSANVDQRLMRLGTKIEQLSGQFSLEKDAKEFIYEMQHRTFDAFLKEQEHGSLSAPLDQESIYKVTTLPPR